MNREDPDLSRRSFEKLIERERSIVQPEFSQSSLEALEQSLDYLSSPKAAEDLLRNPYWPKWDGPWWHMLLLYELGLAEKIPLSIIDPFLESIEKNLLKTFPLREQDIPEGADPYLNIACHCQLGCVYQVLHAVKVDLDMQLAWMRPWFFKYQLADGGLNCDEAAYSRAEPKSSIVSSLPALEAVLYCSNLPFTAEEENFLDRGAQYLIARRLNYSLSSGKKISEDFEKLCFPRFYHYDVLRGLAFVIDWSLRLQRRLPIGAISETLETIDRQFPDGILKVLRDPRYQAKTWKYDKIENNWKQTGANSFPLLELFGAKSVESAQLSQIWLAVLGKSRQLIDFLD